MKTKYLSYAQAYAMIKDYQYLTGLEISEGHKADIITIAPYSKILQWSFATQLARQQPGPVSIENPSGRYDAVVISYKGGPPGSFVITDLRTVLKQCGIAFHPEKYAAIKEQQPMKRITYNLATAAEGSDFPLSDRDALQFIR